ncbi:MAG: dolichyl-phosphate beta-glucosyltransferase [Planctomycetota bacterium]
MELAVVVPAYNEARKILGTLEAIRTHLEKAFERYEIIVVDDGSEDATASLVAGEIARREADPGEALRLLSLRLLRNERNRGKGYSVRRGVLEANLDPVLFTDADLSTPIEETERLYAAIRGGADIVIASRRPAPGRKVRRTLHRRALAAGFRLFVKTVALRGFYDTQCGFKMFRREAARAIFSRQRIERWGFDVEVLFLARRLGFAIAEVPVSWTESPETRLKFTTPLTMLRDLLAIRRNELLGRYR